MSNEVIKPTFTRRNKRLSVKSEVSDLVAVTAKEASSVIKHTLGTASNIAEAIHLETSSFVIGARADKLQDELEAKIEAIQSLAQYGHTQEDIEKEVKKLRDNHITKVLAEAGVTNV